MAQLIAATRLNTKEVSHGRMAQRVVIEAPDFYKSAIAMSPPSDFVDHPAYIEPFMSKPADNPRGYAAASNFTRVQEKAGHILVMPQPLNVNAGFSPSKKIKPAMVEASKHFDLFTFPDVNHWFKAAEKPSKIMPMQRSRGISIDHYRRPGETIFLI